MEIVTYTRPGFDEFDDMPRGALPATRKQLDYISDLSGGEDPDELGEQYFPGESTYLTIGQASRIIDILKAGG